jgi:hypothetical protein
MMERNEAILLVNFVNFVRNLHFYQLKLMPDRGSHKVHKVHKLTGDRTSLRQSGQAKTVLFFADDFFKQLSVTL